ncbi:MAG: LPS assembly lipoprotein LptE [bacterium]
MLRRVWLTWLLATSVLPLSGCGLYSSSSGRVDETIRQVAIPYLENQSPEPNIEIELTEAIIDALQDDNTLKVVDENSAQSILSGRVVQYRLKEAFAQDQRVNEYQIQIMVELAFTVRATGAKIFEKKRLTGTGNYILNDPDGRDETTARQEAAAEIVREVLALIVEDW